MKAEIRALLAVLAGMAVAFVLVVLVEMFSAVVHPLPPELVNDIPEHVRRYPSWILGVVVPMWGATGFAAAWVAARIAGRVAGAIVTVLLALGLAFNLAMLPYPLWFKAVMGCTLPIACLLGISYGSRPRAATR
jgi:hypothetical protein